MREAALRTVSRAPDEERLSFSPDLHARLRLTPPGGDIYIEE